MYIHMSNAFFVLESLFCECSVLYFSIEQLMIFQWNIYYTQALTLFIFLYWEGMFWTSKIRNIQVCFLWYNYISFDISHPLSDIRCVIRVKRIYNFWLFHATFMLLALIFILSLWFILTNLLIVAKAHNVLVLHFDV